MNTYRICRTTLTGLDEDEDFHMPTLKTKSSEAIFGQQERDPHQRQPVIATVKWGLDSDARLKERSFVGWCMNDSEVPIAVTLN